jgi:ATP-dependent DNA ligase
MAKQSRAGRMALPGETDRGVFMYAFDMIELDGEDMRREPLELRKITLNVLLGRGAAGHSL